jgi:hypothetical protein
LSPLHPVGIPIAFERKNERGGSFWPLSPYILEIIFAVIFGEISKSQKLWQKPQKLWRNFQITKVMAKTAKTLAKLPNHKNYGKNRKNSPQS